MGFESHGLNRRTFTISAGAGAAALTIGGVSRATAQDATPEAGGPPALPPLPEGATVVADGLWNPRYVAIADDGTVYVTEVGIGGDEVFPPEVAAEEATPEGEPVATPVTEEAPVSTRGYTGQITQVAPDGAVSVIAAGLASYSDGVGPTGIAVLDGQVYFNIGGAAVLAGVEPLDGENGLHHLDPATGEVMQIAEFNTFEIENNPDGTDVNPNLYGLTASPDSQLIVVDAGGNTLFNVDPATGEFALWAVVPNLTELSGVEPGEGQPPRQPVPTDGAYDADGVYFQALLSEGWPEDGASIVTVSDEGAFGAVVNGRSMVTGVAFGPDGQLYFSQLMDIFAADAPPFGTIFRANVADGTVEPVVEGLLMPHGIAFDGDGNLYVTTQVLMTTPEMAMGQLVRIDGVATVG